MTWTARRLGLSAALFFGVVLVGAWPSPRAALVFSAIYCPLSNLVLAPQTFGRGGHARLVPFATVLRRASDNVTADATLSLTIDQVDGDLRLGLSTRRDAYLPLLVLVAVIAAAPLAIGRRLRSLAIGVPMMFVVSIATTELLVIWTFATQIQGVYVVSGITRGAVELAYAALLSPPGNRFIVPLVLAGALVAWQVRQEHGRRLPPERT